MFYRNLNTMILLERDIFLDNNIFLTIWVDYNYL
jgi:hypothetical protein